jgi:hypothetical protein
MLVDEVSAEGPRILVHPQAFTFWRSKTAKGNKADRLSLLGGFDAN